MVSLKGQYTLQDLKDAHALHARMGLGGRIFMIILAVLFVVPIVWDILSPTAGGINWTLLVFPVLFLGILALFWFVLRPNQIRRAFRQNKELSSPFEMDLSEEGYAFTNEFGSAKLPWSNFPKYKEDEKVLLLYRTDNMFSMVPKRLLQDASQAQYIRDQIVKNGVKEASRVRNPTRMVMQVLVWVLLLVAVGILIYINIK